MRDVTATQIARAMVCRFGMSDKLGPVTFGRENHEVFLGRDFTQDDRNYSDTSAQEIDNEVKRFLDEAAMAAGDLLEKHRKCLDSIAETLLEREVIQGKELDEMLEGKLCQEEHAASTPSSEPSADVKA